MTFKQIWRGVKAVSIEVIAVVILVSAGSPLYAQEQAVDSPFESASSAALPEGFQFVQIAGGLKFPVDMSILDSGEVLVAEKGFYLSREEPVADVRLVRNGVVLPEPVVRLSANVQYDSGIFGLTIDPDFATNHYFYVWYATGPDAPSPPAAGTTVNRLVRLTFDPATDKVVPGSYTIILDNVFWSPYHDGGGLRFMADDTLLISTGDSDRPARAQDLAMLNGKVLRIRPLADGYEIPADNPFVNHPSARPEIYALGLRNPFRITRNMTTDRMVVADVGNKTWEEINIATPAANYGWPSREGFCAQAERPPCSSNPPEYTAPLAAYMHSGDDFGGAVTGVAYYEGTTWPEIYRGKLFYTDYDQNHMGWIDGDVSPANVVVFADRTAKYVDLEYWREALYALDIVDGRIDMLVYAPSGNQPPVAQISASQTFGKAPLAVDFSAAGSSDPDDAFLRYRWDFGDGTPLLETAIPAATHTYTADKNYLATLAVVDVRGAASQPVSLEINVYSGEAPTIDLAIAGAPSRTLFHGGDTVTFTAKRSTTTDLATVPWTWRVALHHNDHSHPDITDLPSASGTYEIPVDNHGGATNLWYRFTLTMHTNTGQAVTVVRDLMPQMTSFEVRTNPDGSGLALVEEVVTQTPATIEAIAGDEWHLRAVPEQVMGGSVYRFTGWQAPATPAGADPALTIVATTAKQTYTATYTFDRPAEMTWLSHIEQ